MSEMVERVARAMEKRASQPLANIPSLNPVLVGSLGDAWECLAVAAIAEMRRPTVAMECVGYLAIHRNRHEPKSVVDILPPIWGPMIDEALKP